MKLGISSFVPKNKKKEGEITKGGYFCFMAVTAVVAVLAVMAVTAVMAVMVIILRKKQRKHRAWKKKMNCTFFARPNF